MVAGKRFRAVRKDIRTGDFHTERHNINRTCPELDHARRDAYLSGTEDGRKSAASSASLLMDGIRLAMGRLVGYYGRSKSQTPKIRVTSWPPCR